MFMLCTLLILGPSLLSELRLGPTPKAHPLRLCQLWSKLGYIIVVNNDQKDEKTMNGSLCFLTANTHTLKYPLVAPCEGVKPAVFGVDKHLVPLGQQAIS
ncbi:hypothetical protein Hanom_Chr15g01394291 [Helianthus anomalus]